MSGASSKVYAAMVRLEREVEELKAGACRFNCRTAKDNWIDGFNWALCRWDTPDSAEVEYERYKETQKG
jgi:hypothetical protein